jgi:pimeloyl-ACP methyl ester carboxylesterase
MRLTGRIPSPQEVALDVLQALSSMGVEKVDVVGHSYGTLVASALLKAEPERVSALTLIDPVCFALFLPTLVRAGLYHLPPTHATQQEEPKQPGFWSPRRLLKGECVCACVLGGNCLISSCTCLIS